VDEKHLKGWRWLSESEWRRHDGATIVRIDRQDRGPVWVARGSADSPECETAEELRGLCDIGKVQGVLPTREE
jgi:hypothetical protein